MKLFIAALFFFLIAFAGLAAGLILKRKGLRGGCTPNQENRHNCQCKPETSPARPGGHNQQTDCEG